MEAGTNFIQEALRGFLKCLGLEGGGGKAVANTGGEEVRNNPSPPTSPPHDVTATETNEPLPTDDTSTLDPLVNVLSSTVDDATIAADIINNAGAESNFSLVTIDEIINTSGGTTAEAQYIELLNEGQPNMNLITTRLISSGGGGKTH